MAAKITIIVLAGFLVLAAGLLAYLFSYISELETTLTETEAKLTQTVASLVQKQSELIDTKDNLARVSNELAATSDELSQVRAELSRKEAYYKSEVQRLQSDLDWMTTLAENNKFFFYYVKPKQEYGVNNLNSLLTGREWLKDYKEYVFDCSEMSASLEWKLENAGFHTIIVIGDSPDRSASRHAWLLVETTAGKYMPVEATTRYPSVVWWDSPYFDNYFRYDFEFETIQEALDYAPTEFDWWQ